MTNVKKTKMLLMSSLAAVAIASVGYTVAANAQESDQKIVTVDGTKPLDNLGEIAEKPKLEEDSKKHLFEEDEKVGETVNIEELKRVDKLGNTNKEFETFEDAERWAKEKKEEQKISSFKIWPVLWSDNIAHSYTVDATLNSEVQLEK